jgi:hypothetical protein
VLRRGPALITEHTRRTTHAHNTQHAVPVIRQRTVWKARLRQRRRGERGGQVAAVAFHAAAGAHGWAAENGLHLDAAVDSLSVEPEGSEKRAGQSESVCEQASQTLTTPTPRKRDTDAHAARTSRC